MKLKDYLDSLDCPIYPDQIGVVEFLGEYTRCRADPSFRFGWESMFLLGAIARKFKPKTFLEIGTGRGTTSYLMSFAKCIETIHTYDIVPHDQPQHTWFRFKPTVMSVKEFADAVMADQPERAKIHFHCGDTSKMEPKDIAQVPGGYDLIYIDGSHDCGPVAKDYKNALQLVSPSGMIVFDDYKRSLPGVRQAVDMFIRPDHPDLLIVSLCGHVFGPSPEPDDEGHVILQMKPKVQV
jgi:hypothetical protein